MLDELDALLGRDPYVALTADHGVTPMPRAPAKGWARRRATQRRGTGVVHQHARAGCARCGPLRVPRQRQRRVLRAGSVRSTGGERDGDDRGSGRAENDRRNRRRVSGRSGAKRSDSQGSAVARPRLLLSAAAATSSSCPSPGDVVLRTTHGSATPTTRVPVVIFAGREARRLRGTGDSGRHRTHTCGALWLHIAECGRPDLDDRPEARHIRICRNTPAI